MTLYNMNPRQIRAAIEQARASGDDQRVLSLTEQLALLEQIATSFQSGECHD